MRWYITRRLLQMPIIIVGVTLGAFMIFHFAPGDPVEIMAEEGATEERLEQLREKFALDEPVHVQYWNYLTNIVQLDLGISLRTQLPVGRLLYPAVWRTLQLTLSAMALTIVIGVPVGILAAVKKRTVVDWGIMSVSSLGLSAPLFWTGFLLMYIFAVWLGWLPVISGGAGVKGLILPALSLAVYWGAVVARMTRSSMLEVLSADYTRTARTKGLSELVVVYKHALRNAALPIITVLGLMMGRLFGGAVIAESVFGWPGMGRLIINAIFWRDHALVQSGLLVAGVMFAFINLVVDILYAFLDPRIRYS